VVLLLLASQHAQLTALIIVLAFGFLVGTAGHMMRAPWLILTGILLIGLASAYFLIYAEAGTR
jgi:hypothetical protein